jgi:hypothetical protein
MNAKIQQILTSLENRIIDMAASPGSNGLCEQAWPLILVYGQLNAVAPTITGGTAATPLALLATKTLEIATDTVATLPDIPSAATNCEIQYRAWIDATTRADSGMVILTYRLDGTDPNATDYWEEYQGNIKLTTRNDLTGLRIKRASGIAKISARIAYYG